MSYAVVKFTVLTVVCATYSEVLNGNFGGLKHTSTSIFWL